MLKIPRGNLANAKKLNFIENNANSNPEKSSRGMSKSGLVVKIIVIALLQLIVIVLFYYQKHKDTTEVSIASEMVVTSSSASPSSVNSNHLRFNHTITSSALHMPHFPPSSSLPSLSLRDNIASPKISGRDVLETLHAVTYASHGGRDDRFCRALESSIWNGYDLVILGWGSKWRGLSQKLQAAYDYAKVLPIDHQILFSDAFDVIYNQGNKTLSNIYTSIFISNIYY